MFSLTPLGDLTRFLNIENEVNTKNEVNIKNEVYLVTEDRCIKSNAVLLAARSAKIEQILEEREIIEAVQFSDNMAGLEDCLDLVYGGSVDIRENNCKCIYKFGKLFQINEMIAGVLAWIANNVTYDNFWSVYLDLKNLHKDTSVFVNIIKGYFRDAGDNFVEHTTEICRSQDKNTITSVVELLSKINDIRVFSVMENIVDTATEDNETVVATTSSTNANNYLLTVESSTVIVNYIENYLQTNNCDEFRKSRCVQTLHKASCACTNMPTLRKINKILFDTSIQAITSIRNYRNFAADFIKDLGLTSTKVNELTSPTTSYGVIKCFTEGAAAGTGIHPCVVVEIVLKWWSQRTDRRGEYDMSFITPLITTIHTVSSYWYGYVVRDERYTALMASLDIPKPVTLRYMHYTFFGKSYKRELEDCILYGSSSDDYIPVNYGMHLKCSDDDKWKIYKDEIPGFIYECNDAEFPPYRNEDNTEHHWYIYRESPQMFVSFIADSQDEILSYIASDINNRNDFELHFVPQPGTFW